MPAKAKCCSKRSVALKKAAFAKAKADVDRAAAGGGKRVAAKKASAKKATAKKAKPCTVCGA